MACLNNDSDLHDNLNTFIITNIFLFALFIIGLILQIKIIIVSKKEKDITWKLDISHSLTMIIYFFLRILFEIITHITQSLHLYTGKWVCYVALFVNLYGTFSVTSHSLTVSIHKYIFIVHQNRIRRFRIDRADVFAFWANLIFPGILAISVIARPSVSAFSSVFSCLGTQDQYADKLNETSKALLQRYLFCGVDDFKDNDSVIGYIMNVVNSMGCFITSVLFFIIMTNMIEGFLYRQIFVYTKR